MIPTHLSMHSLSEKEHDSAHVLLGKGTTRASLPASAISEGTGVAEKDIDPITYATLRELFPPDRTAWLAFLAGLLRHATIESSRNWAHVISFPVEGDVAVVSCTGVKDLSRKLGLAYATTHLYGTLFKAIGLLIEYQNHDHQHIILFPLSSYHLPVDLPARLAQMKAGSKDKQVHHLVDEILSHRSRPPRQKSPKSVQQEITLQQIHTLQQILLSEGVADQDGRIATRIITAISCFASGAVVDPLEVVFAEEEQQQQGAQRSAIAEDTTYTDSCSDTRQLQNMEALLNTSSALVAHGSQDSQQNPSQEGERVQPKSRIDALLQTETFAATNLLTDEGSLDSSPAVSINGIGHFFSEIPADSDRTDTISGGQDGCALTKIPSPTQVLSTRERRGLATALAWIVEGKADNIGAFIEILKRYDSQIILAAVIATLIRKHFPGGMGPLERPGGYYTKRCKEYQQTGIPDEIRAFMQNHESLSYQQIDRLLFEQAQEQKIRNKRVSYTNLPQEIRDDLPPLLPPHRGTWMNRQTAEALARRIPREAPDAKVAGVHDVQQGLEMVSVVDVEVAGVLWTFPSQEDWLDYIVTVRHLETLSK